VQQQRTSHLHGVYDRQLGQQGQLHHGRDAAHGLRDHPVLHVHEHVLQAGQDALRGDGGTDERTHGRDPRTQRQTKLPILKMS
jgi:hypothetical protein